jgi:hypothetical protein
MYMHKEDDATVDFPLYKISQGIKNMKEGLQPELLAYWYKRIEYKAIENAPSNLKDKIHFQQDRVLWMKFKMDVSKRVVPYVMQVIEEYIPLMPYSTGLYFRKVQQILSDEITKELR